MTDTAMDRALSLSKACRLSVVSISLACRQDSPFHFHSPGRRTTALRNATGRMAAASKRAAPRKRR